MVRAKAPGCCNVAVPIECGKAVGTGRILNDSRSSAMRLLRKDARAFFQSEEQ